MVCQGAVENLLERSSHIQLLDGSVVKMTEEARDSLLKKLNFLSIKALRCLGMAYKDDLDELSDYDGENHPGHKSLLDPTNYDSIESNLIFVGMAGLRVIIVYHLLCFVCHSYTSCVMDA